MMNGYGAFGPRMMDGGQLLGGHVFGGFGVLAFGAFVFAAAVLVGLLLWTLANRHRSPAATAGPATAPAADAAITIARERLARGDIDAAQYESIVAALAGRPAPAGPAQAG